MTAEQVLAQHGIQRAADVIKLAAQAGLDLAAAATMLEKESGGGSNVFGHDRVHTGGIYELGQPVTKDVYRKYKAARQRGEIGCQGVGPTQLTLAAFQDRADEAGGCYDWAVNCRVGFSILAGEIRSNGTRDGFRAYNGSGQAAEDYAADAMRKMAVWQARLGDQSGGTGGGTTGGGTTGGGTTGGTGQGQRASLHEGDTGPAVAALQTFLNDTFPLYSHIDLGPQRYGPQTVAVVAEFQRRAGVTGPDANGRTVGPRTWAALERFGFR